MFIDSEGVPWVIPVVEVAEATAFPAASFFIITMIITMKRAPPPAIPPMAAPPMAPLELFPGDPGDPESPLIQSELES